MANLLSLNINRISRSGVISFILLGSIILSYAIVYQNYNIILLLASVFLVSIMLRSNVIPISIILLTIPFSDWAVEYNLLPPQIMWFPELLSLLLFVKAVVNRVILKQRINLFGIRVVLGFLGVIFVSLIYNGSSIVSALLFLRLLFRYYLLFLAILNLDLDERSMRLLNNILIFIFVAQLPLSVVKLFVIGQGESSLGLSSHSVSTIFPLIAIAFLFSFYFLYKRKLIYILLTLGFVGFSIIGGKRAFIFFLPVVLLYLAWSLKDKIKISFRFLVLGILIISISLYFVSRLIPTLNPERRIWGEFDPMYMMSYAYTYSTHRTESGMATGRISATMSVFNILRERGLYGFSFGFGPGCIMKSAFRAFDKREALETRFGVAYGTNGLNWLGLQVGYLGVFIYFLLFYLILRKSVRYFKKEADPYWCSFGFGMVGFSFTMLFLSLFYGTFFNHSAISAFYFCLAGFLMKRMEIY